MTHRTVAGRCLRHVPALADITRDEHEFVVIQKSAQVGMTEALVNIALHGADTRYAGRGIVLYAMPTQSLMDDFAQARFDRAIQDSAYLRGRLQPEPPRRKGADSKRLKRVGDGYIYLRGSESRRQMAGVDADKVILDEFDQMAEGVLELAKKRLSSSRLGQLLVASTPRLPEAGINGLYLQSDQRRYHLRCPLCGHWQALEWEQNIDLKHARVVCSRSTCRKPMDVLEPGHWVPTCPGNAIRGYHLSRLYAPWTNIPAMIEASRTTTPSGQQAFYNEDLGETFVPPGGRLSFGDLDACRRQYEMPDGWKEETAMGVDVGLRHHVVIRTWPDADGRSRALFIGDVGPPDELDDLMTRYNVRRCVIDAQPEPHLAYSFAKKWGYRVGLAYYDRHVGDHEWKRPERVHLVHINRVKALEETFQRFQQGLAELPRDARRLGGDIRDGVGEYYREMTAMTRSLEQNGQGNWVSRYVNSRKADHFAHAEAYCLLAKSGPDYRIYA